MSNPEALKLKDKISLFKDKIEQNKNENKNDIKTEKQVISRRMSATMTMKASFFDPSVLKKMEKNDVIDNSKYSNPSDIKTINKNLEEMKIINEAQNTANNDSDTSQDNDNIIIDATIIKNSNSNLETIKNTENTSNNTINTKCNSEILAASNTNVNLNNDEDSDIADFNPDSDDDITQPSENKIETKIESEKADISEKINTDNNTTADENIIVPKNNESEQTTQITQTAQTTETTHNIEYDLETYKKSNPFLDNTNATYYKYIDIINTKILLPISERNYNLINIPQYKFNIYEYMNSTKVKRFIFEYNRLLNKNIDTQMEKKIRELLLEARIIYGDICALYGYNQPNSEFVPAAFYDICIILNNVLSELIMPGFVNYDTKLTLISEVVNGYKLYDSTHNILTFEVLEHAALCWFNEVNFENNHKYKVNSYKDFLLLPDIVDGMELYKNNIDKYQLNSSINQNNIIEALYNLPYPKYVIAYFYKLKCRHNLNAKDYQWWLVRYINYMCEWTKRKLIQLNKLTN